MDVPPVQFFFAPAFGIIRMLPPDFQLSAQPIEIEIGKRAVRSVEVANGALQNRARADMVASGLVMKGDRQLNHTLEVPAQGTMTGSLTPGVLENLVGVEKVCAVEQIKASAKAPLVGCDGHNGLVLNRLRHFC
jgi:hypothetical protein